MTYGIQPTTFTSMKTRPVLEYDDVLLEQRYSEVLSRKDVSTKSYFSRNIPVNFPVAAAPMVAVVGGEMVSTFAQLGMVAVTHRFQSIEQQAKDLDWTKHGSGTLVGSVGISSPRRAVMEARRLSEAGADGVVVDVAHGGLQSVMNTVLDLKKYVPELDVIAGNVMTADLAQRLESAGADAIRVGIGPGAVCTTRMKTGVGGGQLTAVYECAQAVKVPVIADGGIREYGDIVKALAAGASCVMIGSMFAGTPESPLLTDEEGNRVHRGSAYPHEGKAVKVEPKPSVRVIIDEMNAALRSGMTYLGARTIAEMPSKAIFRVKNSRS